MSRDASLRNQSLHCHYHQDKGHTTKECRTLRDHLSQLARVRKLNHFLCQPRGQFEHHRDGSHCGNTPRPELGTINIILAKPGGEFGTYSRVMSVRSGLGDHVVETGNQIAKKVKLSEIPTLAFFEEDKEGTCQSHDDALVVTVRIGGYDSPLVGLDGKPVIPQGMIRLPVQVEDEEVQVNFIVVKVYSPYTTILARPWLHAMATVSSTLHVKVKYPTSGQVKVLFGSQSVARKCLVSAIIRTTENLEIRAD
ncbi:uncharacterized protein LOC142644138 [Castanea sativa]|uniref:uncharacterized protein LOC142644138 n=1 Tax=Castanea sativa TaxID=21020 RepID=UPI003F64B781